MDHLDAQSISPRSSSKAHRFGLIIIPQRRRRDSHGLTAQRIVQPVGYVFFYGDGLVFKGKSSPESMVKIPSNMTGFPVKIVPANDFVGIQAV